MRKKIFIMGGIALGVAALAAAAVFALRSGEGDRAASAVQGVVFDIAQSARAIGIRDGSGREITLALVTATRILDENGTSTSLAYIRRGFIVRGQGEFTDAVMIPSEVQVLQAPAILVFEPAPDAAVGLPLVVRGEARVFENQFNVRLLDKDGAILAEGTATARSPDVGEYGPFEIVLSYPAPRAEGGAVEVFDYSARDGSEENKVTVPVSFAPVESVIVKTFFGNGKWGDPQNSDCRAVYPVERRVAKTEATAHAALEELLRGPTAAEQSDGFFTSINAGVSIQLLSVENGTARADFSRMLEDSVGGSCRVAAIRAQIAETLKQFPLVRDVIISIDGRTEDILQP